MKADQHGAAPTGMRLRPRPRSRSGFLLTPLVDVMFLLLIFFMLSSQTAPYFLLPVSAEPSAQSDPAQEAPTASSQLVVAVGDGYARFNGERIVFAQLEQAVRAAMNEGYAEALVTTGARATTQDLVTVLETFRGESFARVQLVAPAAGVP